MMLALKSGPQIAAKVGNPAGLLCRRIWYSVVKSGVLGITEYPHLRSTPVNPQKLAIRLFFYSYSGGGLQWFAVVCLLFIVFTAYRLKFWWWFEVVCVGLWWFAVRPVCGGLRWFVMVCVGLSYSHTHK